MDTSIKLPKDKLTDLDVGLVYQFGSTISEIETPLSDLDIGVVFLREDSAVLDNPGIFSELYRLFCECVHTDKEIDMVYLQKASLRLQYELISHGKVVYEIDPDFRYNYEEKVLREYLDFQPIEAYFDHALIQRLT